MKKTTIAAFVVAALCGTTAFAQSTGTPVLKNRVDSLNYAFGLANGDGIKMYYLYNDSTGERYNSLMKGIEEGLKVNPEYAELIGIGRNIGQGIKQQAAEGLMGNEDLVTDIELIKQGLINGMLGYDQMSASEAQNYLNVTMQQLQEKKNEELYGENRRQGEEFLAENKTKEGVVTTESGLQYKVIKMGKGKKPSATDRVKVHYHGTLVDGTVFDSSVNRGEPATFGVNQVIKGWTEALQLMPVGSKWTLYIPYNLAYGAQNTGTIKPYSALIFEVELLGIEK